MGACREQTHPRRAPAFVPATRADETGDVRFIAVRIEHSERRKSMQGTAAVGKWQSPVVRDRPVARLQVRVHGHARYARCPTPFCRASNPEA